MQKVKLAVCMGDKEYEGRFRNCLMRHYSDRFELYVFGEPGGVVAETAYDVLLSDLPPEEFSMTDSRRGSFVYLSDPDDSRGYQEMEGAVFVDKYQEVNRIVEQVLSLVSDEVREVCNTGTLSSKTRVSAVYSLTETGFQLPFAMLMGSVLGEKERVLFLDMQESSGFCRDREPSGQFGMEELLVMADSGNYTGSRLLACIQHQGAMDYVYPVEQSDRLGELSGDMCRKMIAMIRRELDYDVILINFGTRFPGFLDFLCQCQELFLLEKPGGSCRWREESFLQELDRSGYGNWKEQIRRVEMPGLTAVNGSWESLAEQWKWNEMGDLIRKMASNHAGIG